jgi:NAD-dependent dihydropyrimidine dehydrogenase PreA subunit
METTINLFSYSCEGCGRCVRVCPNQVLKVINTGKVRLVNVVKAESCTGCGKCEEVCPHHVIKIENYLV